MPAQRDSKSLTVPFLFLLYLNSAVSSRLDVPEEQLIKQNRVPVIFVDFFAEDFSPDEVAKSTKSEFEKEETEFEKALETFVRKNKELQQQEDVIRPDYAKIDDGGLAHERKKKGSVIETESYGDGSRRINDYDRRTDSSSYEGEVDFDDASIDSLPPPYSSRNPYETSGESAEDYHQDVSQEKKPSLVLTHGGYQNLHKEKRPTNDHSGVKSRKKKGRKHFKKDDYSHGKHEKGVDYDLYPPMFSTAPGMGLTSPLTGMFSNPALGYSTGTFSGYPGFSDHSYLYNSPLMDYYMGRLPNRGISNYPSPLSGGFYRSPGELNIPDPRQIPANYIPLGSPFDAQSRLPYAGPSEQPNSYENSGYQTFDDAPRSEDNGPPPYDNDLRTGRRTVSSSDYYGGSPVTDLNQSPGSYPYYGKYEPPQYGPPPSYTTGPNVPQSASGSSAISGESMERSKPVGDGGDQKSESLSVSEAEQRNNSPVHSSNEYLNYPTEDAGYGIVEPLPTGNGTSVTKTEKPPLPPPVPERVYPPLPRYVPSDMLYRPRFYYGSNFPSYTSTNGKDPLPGKPEGNPKAKQNGTFDAEQYFKNLRSSINIPFRQASPPVSGDSPFLDYSKMQTGRTNFHRPIFPSGSDTAAGGNGNRYPFDFLNNRSKGSGSNINPDITPECAKKENSTICFEDAEYPKNEVQYILNSEAILIQRLLAPANFQGFIGLENADSGSKTSGSEDICKVNINYGQPLRAADVDGKWKIIVNTGGAEGTREFAQSVRLETCSNPGEACSHTDKSVETHCVQKHSLHRLLVWDHDNGLHMALFKLPTACACQIAQARSA